MVQTAKAFGVTIDIYGKVPVHKWVEQLFLEAATEAMTNAVRHADARALYIRFSETDMKYQVSFQNDGKLPETDMIEGGGLGSLRRKIEMAGGTMSIGCDPRYTLTVSVEKKGGESL